MRQRFTIDIAHLRVLRELNERGTVTAAAAALHLSPSAVSQQLRALARAVGAPMTTPHGRRVLLTPQALLLLDHAQAIDARLERARADIAAFDEGRAGLVTVGAFASAIPRLVVPALAQIADERPGLEVTIRELEAPECFTRLDDAEIDLAIAVDYAEGPTHADPRYHRLDLVTDPLLAVLPKGHRLARRRAIRLEDLAHERWVMGTPGHPCIDAAVAAQSAAGFTPDVAHRSDDWNAAAALVSGGHGVALIPRLALEAAGVGVAVVPITPSQPARNIYAIVRSGREHSPHIVPVLDALRRAADQCRPHATAIC